MKRLTLLECINMKNIIYYRIIQNVFLPMKHFLKVFCVSGPCKKKIHERIIIITADLI